MLALVFKVIDLDTKETIVPENKIDINITEKELVKADRDDADQLARENAIIGECFANMAANGRGKFVRETFDSIGIIVSKFLQRSLASHFGNTRMFELLDEAATQRRKLLEQQGSESSKYGV